MTVPELYRRYYRQRLASRAARGEIEDRTVRDYDRAVALWEELLPEAPSLAETGRRATAGASVCERFCARLATEYLYKGRPLRQNTRRRHLVALRAILDAAGPWGATAEENADRPRKRGLFGVDADGDPVPVPRLALPRVELVPAEKVFAAEEEDRLIAAAGEFDLPRALPGIPARRWWPAVLTWIRWVGTRIGTTLALRREMLSRRAGSWQIRIPPAILKGDRWLVLHVCEEAYAAVESVRTADALLFPWPHCRGWLHDLRLRLEERAGVPHYGFHGFRRCLGTELLERNASAAQQQLGHRDLATTMQSYCRPAAPAQRAIEELAAADRERRARGRAERKRAADAQQRRLFED
jgi:integrase